MMVWWGAPRTDVIQTQPYRPSLGSQSVVHTVEGHHGGTLSHTSSCWFTYCISLSEGGWVRTRDTETGSPARLPGRWAQGIKIVYGEEIIFCTEPTRAAKAEKQSLGPARQAQRTNQGRIPFICTLWVPIHLSFNSQQGPPGFVSLVRTAGGLMSLAFVFCASSSCNTCNTIQTYMCLICKDKKD